ncbi:DUF2834 domain-containing protein [Cyanobium sp. NIES-981]|uniref:DUF2834 domain-containing protein n=1 Tax=Cyanobium sp. NIES-981 TaxID=1851505 RepID=UPI0007DDCEFA|nr:DUF2834 domain-containing protein [Cyanobium sp. NIES-981]SBO44776.1 conserved membrane protein of unknown function [Cyanobium sp. NIES-981]
MTPPEPPAASVPPPTPWLRWVYLVLAIAGAVLPWLANLAYIKEYGGSFDLVQFIQLANVNPAAASLSRDLAIGSTAVVIWMVHEARRLQVRGLAIVLLTCVTVAFACGAPLFLYLRERRLAELARS